MKNYDILVVNGDSYSADSKHFPSYGKFIADKLNIPFVNLSVVGSSNDRILRSTLEHYESIKINYKNPLFLIGWSFLHRVETWYHGKDAGVLSRAPDNLLRLVTVDWIPSSEMSSNIKSLITDITTVDKKIIDWYTNIYLLSNFFTESNIDYWFFSAADNTDFDIMTFPTFAKMKIVNQVLNNNRIFELHKFCISNWSTKHDPERLPATGHLSQAGHEKFSKFILNNLYDLQSHQTTQK
jgi:hypothetical protein